MANMTYEEAKNILSTLNIQGGRRNGKLLLVEASRLAIDALEKVEVIKKQSQNKPIVHAEWKFNGCGNEWYGPSFTCSLCGDEMIGKSNYCPNCGAKMDEER